MSSVANALRILDLLEDGVQLRVVDVARHLGVASSTAHRLLNTLRQVGYVRQNEGSTRYLPGPSVLRLARRISTERTLQEIALPHLQQLCRDLNETVNLQVLAGHEVLFLASAEDQHRLRVAHLAPGTRRPSHGLAGGKILLAQLDPDRVRDLLGPKLAAMTPHTMVDLDRLLAELEVIRAQGYAVNTGETDEGVHAVAVPVLDTDGQAFAALSLAAPAARLPTVRIPLVLSHLRAASAAVSDTYFGAHPTPAHATHARTRRREADATDTTTDRVGRR